MKTFVVFAMWIAISVTGARAAEIIGHGTYSCGEWISDHQRQNADALADDAWVAGYLSAFNVYYDNDPTALNDYGGRTAWMNDYCRSHPLDQIIDATNKLILELKRQQASQR